VECKSLASEPLDVIEIDERTVQVRSVDWRIRSMYGAEFDNMEFTLIARPSESIKKKKTAA
jgi:hypothetical protein